MKTVFQVLFDFRWTQVEVAIVFTWPEKIGKYSLIVKALLVSDCNEVVSLSPQSRCWGGFHILRTSIKSAVLLYLSFFKYCEDLNYQIVNNGCRADCFLSHYWCQELVRTFAFSGLFIDSFFKYLLCFMAFF